MGLATSSFPIARVLLIFERSDQADATDAVAATAAFGVQKEYLQVKKGGNKSLELHEFFEMLVMLSFA